MLHSDDTFERDSLIILCCFTTCTGNASANVVAWECGEYENTIKFQYTQKRNGVYRDSARKMLYVSDMLCRVLMFVVEDDPGFS